MSQAAPPTVIAIDTETWPIARQPDGSVIPRLVCASFSDGVAAVLWSTADAELEPLLRGLLTDPTTRVVFHNAAFDVPVLCKAFPAHESLWWEALHAGRVSDTMLREQLLSLSTTGRLDAIVMPDGTEARAEYDLGSLVLRHLHEDISESKDGTQRTSYHLLDGIPAAQYPAEAARYALKDAAYTRRVFDAQQELVASEDGYSSLSTECFQAAVSVALAWITDRGMAVDPVKFREMQAMLERELSPENMRPLLDAGILRPAEPALPHKRHEAMARDLVSGWLGIASEDVDWERLDPRLRGAAEAAGIKFKAPVASSLAAGELRRLVLAVQVERAAPTLTPSPRLLTEEALEEKAKELGISYKRTDKGAISTAKEVIEGLASYDPVIACYQRRQKLQKLVTTELPRMTWQGEPAPEVHFCFRTLVETSRTSSYASDLYPSANGQNVDPRARPCFVPRPGYLLCSADYATLELVCVAQTTYDLFGRSVHRDKINAGYDLHAYLGAQLALHLDPTFRARAPHDPDQAYQFFLAMKKHEREYFKRWRKLAKPVGLGLPGGLGPQKLIELAIKEPYFVDVVAMAEERARDFPEEFQVTRALLYHAKRLHRMTEDTFAWTPLLRGIALASRLRDVWLTTYPEMRQYFEWVALQEDQHTPVLTMETGDEEAPEREVAGLCYTTPMGMHRAASTFTSVANGRAMQSPAAEGFKCAVFNLVRACRDPASTSILRGNAHVVDEIHDELLVEVREDMAHDLASEVGRIMVESMRMVIADVAVKAEPCLMRRWYKQAEPVHVDGRLIPWEPEEKEVA